MTKLEDFDDYCARNDIKEGDFAAAFGAWMNDVYDWDGTIEQVTS